jgi:hypothetical protein
MWTSDFGWIVDFLDGYFRRLTGDDLEENLVLEGETIPLQHRKRKVTKCYSRKPFSTASGS